MKKLYEKNELTFALLWIVIYCVLLAYTLILTRTLPNSQRKVDCENER